MMANTPSTREPRPLSLLLMMFLGLVIGIIGGYGAILFRLLVSLSHNLFFNGTFSFLYDADVHTAPSVWGYGFILVPVIGAALVAWIVTMFAPEAKGHGVPEVIDSIYYKQGIIRPTVAFFKSVASAISIGSGGSVGREGPIIQIGSALGSTIGQIVSMPARQRITLIAAGAGAGIAASFNAPIGGIAFAVEILLVATNASTLSVVAIATITAAYIGRIYLGMNPAFDIPELAELDSTPVHLFELLLFVPFGIIMGIASIFFIKAVYACEDFFEAWSDNYYIRHMAGMAVVSVMLMVLMHFTGHYYVDGVGYATVVDVLAGLLTHPGFLFLLFAAKLVATSITVGSGGSGGVFSPALFLGATLGGAVGQALILAFPHHGINPSMFVVAGMAGMLSGSTGAVLTAITMLFEMTRDYNAVLPVMLTVVLAYMTRVRIARESIYTLKLFRRGHEVPEGLQSAMKSSQKAHHLMRNDFEIVSYEQMEDLSEEIRQWQENDIPVVVEHRGHILGLLKPGSTDLTDHLSLYTNYLLTQPQESFLSLLRQMRQKSCNTVFVTVNAELDTIESLLGIITPNEVADHAARSAELMNETA